MKVYFAASIRSGRDMAPTYCQLIDYLKSKGHEVLTEHIGDSNLTGAGEKGMTDSEIFTRDLKLLARSHVTIAEVTTPSTGVGYEIGFSLNLEHRVLCLYQHQPDRKLSAMIAGNPRLTVKEYNTVEQACAHMDDFIQKMLL